MWVTVFFFFLQRHLVSTVSVQPTFHHQHMPSSNKDMATVTLCGVLTSLLLLILHLGTTLSASSTVSFRNCLNQVQMLCGFEGINPWQYHEQSHQLSALGLCLGCLAELQNGEFKWYRTDTCYVRNDPFQGSNQETFRTSQIIKKNPFQAFYVQGTVYR